MTGKQLNFLVCLLQNSSVAKAIKESGIPKSTGYKWMKDEEFKKELTTRKKEILSSVAGYLQNSLSDCSERLMEIVNSDKTSAQVKINAISLVFQNARAFTEQLDIVERMERIEKALEEKEET